VIRDAARKAFGDNMIFLFSSDHGTQWPLGKWNCYDAGVRVPLIITWPGVVKPGTRTGAMVSWIDFLPTLVEAVGGVPPANIDGRSFLSVLRGTATGHRDRIFTTHSGDGRWNVYPMRSLRTDRWKYIWNLHPEFAYTTHIDLTDKKKDRAFWVTWEKAARKDKRAADVIRRYRARPGEELYDLVADPGEQHNLAGKPQQAARVKKMRTELEQWMNDQGDQRTVFEAPRLLSDPASYRTGSGRKPPTAASLQWKSAGR
jgi:arylsulfatase A-like enzyme